MVALQTLMAHSPIGKHCANATQCCTRILLLIFDHLRIGDDCPPRSSESVRVVDCLNPFVKKFMLHVGMIGKLSLDFYNHITPFFNRTEKSAGIFERLLDRCTKFRIADDHS